MKIVKKSRKTVIVIFLVVIIAIIIWKKEIVTLFSAGSYDGLDNTVETIMDKSATPGVAMVFLLYDSL